MLSASVKNVQGQETGKVDLTSSVFEVSENPVVMREVLNAYNANQRQGTASTKTRGMVRGGGKKPWRQKHTGRARQGSIRAGQWRGGGTIFGPQPRSYDNNITKNKKRLGLLSALSCFARDGKITVVDSFDLGEKPKTKAVVSMLEALGLWDQKVLIITDVPNDTLLLSARNLLGVKVSVFNNLNIYDLLYFDHLVVNRDGIEKIQETFGS